MRRGRLPLTLPLPPKNLPCGCRALVAPSLRERAGPSLRRSGGQAGGAAFLVGASFLVILSEVEGSALSLQRPGRALAKREGRSFAPPLRMTSGGRRVPGGRFLPCHPERSRRICPVAA